MKYQSHYYYSFHGHFESPLRKFIESEENHELVNKAIDKRIEPNMLYASYSEKNDIDVIHDFMLSMEYSVPFKINEEGIFASGLYRVISILLNTLVNKMPECSINEHVFIGILLGVITHDYYTTGKDGDKIRDLIDQEIEDEKQGKISYQRTIRETLTKLIPFHTEVIASKDHISSQETLFKFYKKLLKK